MMVHKDNFHFVGRACARQVAISDQASEYTLSFHLPVRKTTCEQISFFLFVCSTVIYLSVYSVPGRVLDIGDIIVNNSVKSPAHVGFTFYKGRVE